METLKVLLASWLSDFDLHDLEPATTPAIAVLAVGSVVGWHWSQRLRRAASKAVSRPGGPWGLVVTLFVAAFPLSYVGFHVLMMRGAFHPVLQYNATDEAQDMFRLYGMWWFPMLVGSFITSVILGMIVLRLLCRRSPVLERVSAAAALGAHLLTLGMLMEDFPSV